MVLLPDAVVKWHVPHLLLQLSRFEGGQVGKYLIVTSFIVIL